MHFDSIAARPWCLPPVGGQLLEGAAVDCRGARTRREELSGLQTNSLMYAVAAPREPHHRSTVGVIGVIAAPASHRRHTSVEPTAQATHLCCKRLRPSIVTRWRRQRQQDVVCALIVAHADYGAPPPAPFEHPAALQLRTGARGVGASWLTHAHSRHYRAPASRRARVVILRPTRDIRDDVCDDD